MALALGSSALLIALVGFPTVLLSISALDKELNDDMLDYDQQQKDIWSNLRHVAPGAHAKNKYKRQNGWRN